MYKMLGAVCGALLAGGIGGSLDPHGNAGLVAITMTIIACTGFGCIFGAMVKS